MFRQPVPPPVPIPASTWAVGHGDSLGTAQGEPGDSPGRDWGQPGDSPGAALTLLKGQRWFPQEKGIDLGVQGLQEQWSPRGTAQRGSGVVVAPPGAWGQQGCASAVSPAWLSCPRVSVDTQKEPG